MFPYTSRDHHGLEWKGGPPDTGLHIHQKPKNISTGLDGDRLHKDELYVVVPQTLDALCRSSDS